MPLHRAAFRALSAANRRPPGGNPDRGVPTCGDLFRATRAFFETDAGRVALETGILAELGHAVAAKHVDGLDVFLVKHGEFYHPCRIEARVDDRRACFVLNIAVSQAGRAQLQNEYGALERLVRELPLDFFPRVYGWGAVQSPLPAAMFLARWLDGFCEFHARRTGEGEPSVAVWDSEGGDRTLTGPVVLEIYRRAAAILAACYNPETFEHVHPWHHAAGDFVVRVANDSVEVRLISARSYGPLFDHAPADTGDDGGRLILEALLVFLLQLSIRMRLDRTDGVGDLVWLNDAVVAATVRGFFDGLGEGCRVRGMPREAMAFFGTYLAAVDEEDLLALCRQLLETHLADEEKTLARPRLPEHCRLLHAALRHG